MKMLLLVILYAIPTLTYAEFLSSSYSGKEVTYMADPGATVKKGGVLCKLSTGTQKFRLQQEKLRLKIAQADLDDKISDIKRSKSLIAKKAISLADHENIVVEYYKSLVLQDIQKSKVKQSENDLEGLVVKAPYDCKIVRQLVCINSGVDYGSYILELQPLNSIKKIDDSDKLAQLLKYASSFSGLTITYLPTEGQFVKKGEVMIQFDTSILDLQTQLLERSLKEAKECMKDAKTDIARSKKLLKAKSTSQKQYENVCYTYAQCEAFVSIKEIELKNEKSYLTSYNVRAPYNLKVVKRILSIGSGTKVGEAIFEIQKI